MKHLNEEQLVLHYYGDADDERAAGEHLKACVECRSEFERLRTTMNAVVLPEPPERDAGYGARVWSAIKPRLIEESEARSAAGSRWSRWFTPQRLALGGTMAALLIVAFAAGRYWHAPTPASPTIMATDHAPAPEKVKERIVLVAVGGHLERSQMMLIELMHADPKHAAEIAIEPGQARELLTENRLYRQSAASVGDNGVADVLGQLEDVLIEIANSPDMDASQLKLVQDQIRSQGLLFKVRVIENKVREQKTQPLASPAANREAVRS